MPSVSRGLLKRPENDIGYANIKNMPSYLDNLALFPSAVVRRGEDYFRKGNVLSLDIDEQRVVSKVQGSRNVPYRVELRFSEKGKSLLSASCSCPCYGDCKHIVAVLFALEERERTAKMDAYEGSKENYLRTLQMWETNDRYVSASFLKKTLSSLIGVLSKEVICDLLIETYIAFVRKEYLQSAVSSRSPFPELEELTRLASIDKKDFVREAMQRGKKKDFFLESLVFKCLLSRQGFLLETASYFMELYKEHQQEAISLLKAFDLRLPYVSGADPSFIALFFLYSKAGPSPYYDDLLLKSGEFAKNPKILEKTLLVLANDLYERRQFYKLFTEYKRLVGSGDALKIGKKILEGRPSEEDILFLLETFTKEEFLAIYRPQSAYFYRPYFDFLAFYFYPSLGEFDKKKVPLSLLLEFFDYLSEAQKAFGKEAAESFLSKKRKLSRKDETDALSSLLILLYSNESSALTHLHDSRVSSFLETLDDGGRGISLLIESRLKKDEERDFILSKGGEHVSL